MIAPGGIGQLDLGAAFGNVRAPYIAREDVPPVAAWLCGA
jgi:hypothetical protein